MWHRVARLVTIGLTLVVLGASAPADGAVAAVGESGITMTFAPEQVAVGVGEYRAVVLQLTNGTTSAATSMTLDITQDRGISISEEPAVPGTLAPGASVALVVEVSRAADAPPSGSAQAVLRYRTGSGADQVDGAVVATLAVSDAPPSTAPGAPLTITPSPTEVDLVQYQSTDTFFTVTSGSGHTLTVTSAVVSYPTFLTVTAIGPDGTVVEGSDGRVTVGWLGTLGPGDAAIVHLRLDASGPVQPGDGLLMLTVATTDRTSGTTATSGASQSIAFTVLGESGVLEVLGVPSLLFVPGLVFALILWALWKYVYPADKPAQGDEVANPLSSDKALLWVFALLPTLAMPFAYPAITEAVLGQRRDYRRVYGLDDILYVWVLAAVLAVVCWLVVLAVRAVRASVYLPAPGRSELRLLSMFAVRLWNRSLARRSFLYNTKPVVLLGRSADKLLVTSLITYSTENLTDKQTEKVKDGGSLVPGKPFRTWWFFLRRRTSVPLRYVALESQGGGRMIGPTLVSPGDVHAQRDCLSLVVPDVETS